jgi:hypothetical protein
VRWLAIDAGPRCACPWRIRKLRRDRHLERTGEGQRARPDDSRNSSPKVLKSLIILAQMGRANNKAAGEGFVCKIGQLPNASGGMTAGSCAGTALSVPVASTVARSWPARVAYGRCAARRRPCRRPSPASDRPPREQVIAGGRAAQAGEQSDVLAGGTYWSWAGESLMTDRLDRTLIVPALFSWAACLNERKRVTGCEEFSRVFIGLGAIGVPTPCPFP